MADKEISDEAFKTFLAGFRGYGYLQLNVNGRRVDHETFVELMAQRDLKLAERIGRYLEAARNLRNYIEQVYLIPEPVGAQVVDPSKEKESN